MTDRCLVNHIKDVPKQPKIQAEPLIDSHFGMKFESFDEGNDSMTSTLTDVASGKTHIVKSAYVIACDGAVAKSDGLLVST
jgi:2-polyprenyl-6-methoxyphenol hydroxylase-like FAD-dependent oxidoreductase